MSGGPYRDPPPCDHGVSFDENAWREMCKQSVRVVMTRLEMFLQEAQLTASIRARWPRLFGVCPKQCGFNGIAYASFAHQLAGDW